MFRPMLSSLIALLFLGCGPSASLRRSTDAFYRNDPKEALRQLEAGNNSKERYLTSMEKAEIYQRLGELQDSNRELTQTSKAISDKIASISQETVALLSSDYFKTYTGEVFERVYLHTLALANFLALNDTEGAMVEAKRALATLKMLPCSKCDFSLTYELISFAFLSNGEYDDALLALRDGEKNIRSSLVLDPLKVADEALDPYGASFFPSWSPERRKHQFYGIFFLGAAPYKTEDYLPILGTGGIALPRYVSSYQGASQVRIRLGEQEPRLEMVSESIEQLAEASLDARKAALIAKASARIAVQEVLEDAAKDKGDLAKIAKSGVLDLAFMLVNRADLRYWSTLPAQSQLLNFEIPENVTSLELEFLDSRGNLVEKEILSIDPRSEPLFIVRRVP